MVKLLRSSKAWMVIALVLMVPFTLGLAAKTSTPREITVYKTRTVTKVVEVEVPTTVVKTQTVTKKVALPDSCRESLATSTLIDEQAVKLLDAGAIQKNIISETRMAMATDDSAELVKQIDRQTKLQGDTQEASNLLSTLKFNYNKTIAKCKQEIKQ